MQQERHRTLPTPKQLVQFARQIAIYNRYSNLDEATGLQNSEMLNAKYKHEQEEFQEAVADGNLLKILHEGADLLYYAACIEENKTEWLGAKGKPNPLPDYLFVKTLQDIRIAVKTRGHRISTKQMEDAAIAKYTYRASAPNMKDEAYELCLVERAIG